MARNTLTRIKARHTRYPTDEGTFLHDAFAPVAEEIDQVMDVELPEALDRHMLDTATGEDLDRIALAYGITRKGATRATGDLRITGAVDALVPVGMLFSTDAGRMYALDEGGAIPTEGIILLPATAIEAGAAGNVGAGVVTRRVMVLQGVTAVTNPQAMQGGADAESDDAFRERIYERLRNPASSGTERDYRRWALEVPGVEDARCIPRWDGRGTIKVIIAGANMEPADEAVLRACYLHIEDERPFDAIVTVVSGVMLPVDISATLILREGAELAALEEAFASTLRQWLREQAFAQEYLSYARMGAMILDLPMVRDYQNLLINGIAGNMPLEVDSLPMVRSVMFSAADD